MARRTEIREKIGERDRISVVMTALYVVFIGLAIAIAWKIVNIQVKYDVDPAVIDIFRPKRSKVTHTPRRGNILSYDGRPLAVSVPKYDLYMDCTVRKKEFERMDEDEMQKREAAEKRNHPITTPPKCKGAAAEKEWQAKVWPLADTLAAIFPSKTAEQYRNIILTGRENGKKSWTIARDVDYDVYKRVSNAPLFREGRNMGGLVPSRHDERLYPYGALARRTIGHVKEGGRTVGLEWSFNHELHGTDGYEWQRVVDSNKFVHDYDSTSVKAVDGNDIRTTLNIDFQDIADKALRRQIEGDKLIRAGVAIIMEAKSGAIRAMVNLSRGKTDSLMHEIDNLVLREVSEQGSVMKTMTLVSVVEDGFVPTLDMTLPTCGGWVRGKDGKALSYYPHDDHISDYERETGTKEITVLHGFEISSNYVFATLAEKFYGDNPQNFFDKIYSYKLGEAFDFDIEGLRTPVVNRPGMDGWSKPVLGTTAYGYSLAVTPLHVATFYNAIANKGRMMKPYLVESVEKDGVVLKKYGESALNNICSKATADTVTRALMAVTKEGTAQRLKNAKLTVAGKTGTAQIILPAADRGADPYHDKMGRKMNQGTFVGFFPAEDPKYTILVTIYSYLSRTSFYGGTYPALAVKEIVDNIYAIAPDWNKTVAKEGAVPIMNLPATLSSTGGETVPDVKGLGLKDAVYTLENSGYVCQFLGSGHVIEQKPAAGKKYEKGSTVEIILR